ncbi:MAG TPA: S1/P1 nuclease [Pyrinomonadaceae bacterium]|nr:S1/P1 nuclease [Pyrinomonadaceae bacterium]
MRHPYTRNLVARLILISCFLALLPLRAGAWGATGHRLVARIAARHLTSKTAAALSKILEADKEDSGGCRKLATLEEKLACISIWPDDVKRSKKYSYTGPYHYVDIPINVSPSQRHYVRKRDCPTEGCIITALADYRQTLQTSKDDAERAIALKFVVHLIGDLHQPLHNAQDRDRDFGNTENKSQGHQPLKGTGESDSGGNAKLVTWFDDAATQYGCWNLHAVWDEGVIDHNGITEDDYAGHLDSLFNGARKIRDIQRGTPINWANDALALAIKHAYGALPEPVATDKVCEVRKKDEKTRCEEYDSATCKTFEVHYRYHLGQQYYKQALPVVDDQMARGGLRLARYLNSIFDPKGTP